MRGACRIGVWLAATCWLAGMVAAQEPVIRTGTEIVEVTIVASKAASLTASEVRIFDNGKLQSIASFEKIAARSERAEPSSGGVVSNRGADAGRKQVLSVILLDALNTAWSDQSFARAEVVRILRAMRPGEQTAVLVLGNRLRMVHDFSSDTASLLRKLSTEKGENPVGVAPEAPDPEWPFDVSYSEAFDTEQLPGSLTQDLLARRARDTLGALAVIGNALRHVPGRKNLIWVSGGFPLTVMVPGPQFLPAQPRAETFGSELKAAAEALNGADISVYPVDARGLSLDRRAMVNVGVMQEIAAQTGGIAYYNRNDVGNAVREALDDSSEVYVASYRPQPFVEDGSYHKIEAKSQVKGVELRYRRGYYASAANAAGDYKQRLQRALSSPLAFTGIGLEGKLLPEAEGKVAAELRIAASDLDLVRDGDKWVGEVALAAVEVGAAGEVLETLTRAAKITLTGENDRIVLQVSLKRDSRAVTLRVAVTDKRRGNAGSLSFGLTR